MENSRWQSGFILHTRPFSKGRIVLELFLEGAGRVSVVARNLKRWRALLNLFSRLNFFYLPKTSLPNLEGLETASDAPLTLTSFKGARFACAFYLNELLYRLLVTGDGAGRLFKAYEMALTKLVDVSCALEPLLRSFEKVLLEEIGYGIDFKQASDHQPIDPSCHYNYLTQSGFTLASASKMSYLGANLQKIAQEQWDEASLMAAKRLFRASLQPLLGVKPLASRKLLALFT